MAASWCKQAYRCKFVMAAGRPLQTMWHTDTNTHPKYLKDSGYVTRPSAAVGQLHDLLPGGVGQRSPVHKYSPELVDPAVTCVHTNQKVQTP